MSEGQIVVSQEGAVRTIVFNRPEKLNAITVQMDLDWIRALRAAEADDSVRAVIIRGEGKCFSAGHDMVEVGRIMQELGDDASNWENVYAKVWPEGSPVKAIWDADKPIIAEIQGQVVGMMVPAVLCCDLIVAAEGSAFNLEVLRSGGGAGLSPYIGLLPHKLINELAFTGRLSAEQMLAAGAINRVVPLSRLRIESRKIARAATGILPVSSGNFKRSVRAILRKQGIGDPAAMQLGGVQSHGNATDNGFWRRAAETGVADALRWRDENTRAVSTSSQMM
jgi:enoyl-CoA hydratase/carnithine racemase